MNKVFLAIFSSFILLALPTHTAAQISEERAREQAISIVRSDLQATSAFPSDQFVGAQRDEELELLLAVAAGKRIPPVFIYRLSSDGSEVNEEGFRYTISSDVDLTFVVAVASADGSAYRICGFGLAESLANFNRLMKMLQMEGVRSYQAESIAGFYRKVNPQNHQDLEPILQLIDLKQRAEQQCQSVGSFDASEKAFAVWWRRGKRHYAKLSFQETTLPNGNGYLVEWIVLSSFSAKNCGGVPLRAQLQIGSDGRIGNLSFSPLQKH